MLQLRLLANIHLPCFVPMPWKTDPVQSRHGSRWTLGQAESSTAGADSKASSGSAAQLLLQAVKATKVNPIVPVRAMRAVSAGVFAQFPWKWGTGRFNGEVTDPAPHLTARSSAGLIGFSVNTSPASL